MNYLNNSLCKDEIKQIKKEVALINQDYGLSVHGYIKDEIFELIEKTGTLIFYPIDEKNLWGIYVCKNEKHYFIINSAIELEKQVFAAAHELAHSLDIAKVKFEIVTADLMTEYVDHNDFGADIEKADLMANRFAAELLVGSKKLLEKFNELPKIYNISTKAVILSGIFLVPYKTIVKRFVEIGLITNLEEIKDLIKLDDKQIKLIAERHECCRKNYDISMEVRLGGYVNKALMLYENELSTYEELSNRLELLEKKPVDYGIEDTDFDLYDFLIRASESSEVGDDE